MGLVANGLMVIFMLEGAVGDHIIHLVLVVWGVVVLVQVIVQQLTVHRIQVEGVAGVCIVELEVQVEAVLLLSDIQVIQLKV